MKVFVTSKKLRSKKLSMRISFACHAKLEEWPQAEQARLRYACFTAAPCVWEGCTMPVTLANWKFRNVAAAHAT